jgi:ribose transport system substrate-binding protein
MSIGTRGILRLAAGMCLVLGVVGCGNGGKTESTTKPRVAFVLVSTDLNFAKEMSTGFEAGVKQVGGVDCTVAGPSRMDNAGEAKIFQELLRSNQAKDGISLFQQAAEIFAPLIAEAHAKDIPMIAVDNKMDTTSKVDLFVGNDNYALGQTLADEAIGKLPADAAGTVVIGTPVPGIPVLEQRAKGMRDQFNERLPDVDVLGPFDSKQDPLVNLSTWKALVAANPDALAFLGTGDADAYNLASLRKEQKAKWLAGGFDLDPRSLQAVKDGDLLLVSPEHYVKGAIAGRLQAQRAKDGKPLSKGWIYTPGLAVNQANIDEITRRQASAEAKAAWFKPHIDGILKEENKYLRPLSDAK